MSKIRFLLCYSLVALSTHGFAARKGVKRDDYLKVKEKQDLQVKERQAIEDLWAIDEHLAALQEEELNQALEDVRDMQFQLEEMAAQEEDWQSYLAMQEEKKEVLEHSDESETSDKNSFSDDREDIAYFIEKPTQRFAKQYTPSRNLKKLQRVRHLIEDLEKRGPRSGTARRLQKKLYILNNRIPRSLALRLSNALKQ